MMTREIRQRIGPCCGMSLALAVGLGALLAGRGQAADTTLYVAVGDAGNAADATGFGAVGYAYRIGVCEVTRGEYAAFLNAVAASDAHDLYNAAMGITRTGNAGTYAYTAGEGSRPVAWVSWYDALRYANWLHNGQPRGAQGPATTEDGAYAFSGVTQVSARKIGARAFLPNENEWYKAAYFQGGPAAVYRLYPTRSDAAPSPSLPPGGANSVNGGNAMGAASPVGAYTQAGGYYGTRDQAGNVWEWTETAIGTDRGVRGGSYEDYALLFQSWYRDSQDPALETASVGFRVAAIAGTWQTAWFGSYLDMGGGWYHHLQHGWMYTETINAAEIWFWTNDMGWLYTTRAVHPWFYRLSTKGWMYYLVDTVTPRWFYDANSGAWQAR